MSDDDRETVEAIASRWYYQSVSDPAQARLDVGYLLDMIAKLDGKLDDQAMRHEDALRHALGAD